MRPLVRLNAAAEGGVAIDPVCGMGVEEHGAAHTHVYRGRTYYFCSPGCRTAFQKDPAGSLQRGPKPMGGH